MKRGYIIIVIAVLLICLACACTGEKDTKNYDMEIKEVNKEIDTMYVTWINCWNGSTEAWWKGLADTISVMGTKVLIDGEYVCLDNNKKEHREAVMQYAIDAGIEALAMDLTNGYAGWYTICKHYQQMCYENNMKFVVAVHPADLENLKAICRSIFRSYVDTGKKEENATYLTKNGKPLMVLYCTPDEFKRSTEHAGDDEYTSMFEYMWASGEDSKLDKWGWQLEPFVGPMMSSDSMFLTGSLSWNTPKGTPGTWRMSLAWFDFCFLAQREARPAFSIVGSLDDIFERNGWIVADTKDACQTSNYTDADNDDKIKGTGYGQMMRDIYGDISTDVFYNRVCSWIKGTVKPFNEGGIIPDGAYTIASVGSELKFGVTRPEQYKDNDIGQSFVSDKYLETEIESYYWFYHLGNNEYRIIKLTSGLSLAANENSILSQEWTENTDAQKWILKKNTNGSFTFVNKGNGKCISQNGSGKDITVSGSEKTDKCKWILEPVAYRQIQ